MKHLKDLKENLHEQLEETVKEFVKRPTSKLNYDIFVILQNLKMLDEFEDKDGDTYKHHDEKKGLWS